MYLNEVAQHRLEDRFQNNGNGMNLRPQGRMRIGTRPFQARSNFDVPVLLVERAIQPDIVEHELSITYKELGLQNQKCIFDDERAQSSAIRVPQRRYANFTHLSHFKFHCTFNAMNCTSCFRDGNNHSIAGKNVFLLTDQYGPAMVGTSGHCVPVIRIQDMTFDLAREVLRAQSIAGFNPPANSIFLFSPLSMICAMGTDRFWSNFETFAQ